MKLLRRPRLRPTPNRRQKRPLDDLEPAPSSFSYRAYRSERSRGTGRQMGVEAPQAGATAPVGRFWLQRFGLIILLVAIVASAFNILSLSTSTKVLPLASDTSRSFLQPTTVYEAAANQQLQHSIWNRNKLTVNTTQLSQQLLEQFPELSAVSITVPLLAHRPLVYVEPAQPALILVASDGAFVVDTTGKALLRAAKPSDLHQPQLPIVTDQGHLTINTNHQALPADSVSFIQTVIAQLAAKQLTIADMSLPQGTSELDVHLTGQAYLVKFNLQSNNPSGQAGTLLATISQLHRQNIVPAQYIDVRVDGRAYYQ